MPTGTREDEALGFGRFQDLEVTGRLIGPQFQALTAAIGGLTARNETVTLGNSVLRGLDPIQGDVELFDLMQPDCASSLGRRPTSREICYFPAKLKDQNDTEYDNLWSKWTGRGAIGVFKATTNLVQSPEDLTNSSYWSASDLTSRTLLTDTWQGRRWTRLLSNGTTNAANVNFTYGALASTKASFQVCMRKVDATTSGFTVYDSTAPAHRALIYVTWATKAFTVAIGSATIVSANWYAGDTIVEVQVAITGLTSGNSLQVYCYPTYNTTEAKSCDYTAVMLENSPYPTPYTPTSRAAGSIDYSMQCPTAGAFEAWVRPWGGYVAAHYMLFQFGTSGGQAMLVYHNYSQAKWYALLYKDATHYTQKMQTTAHGSDAEWQVWQHIKVAWNLTTGSVSLYINGVLQTGDSSVNDGAGTAPDAKLAVGAASDDTYPIDGLITDLLIWDTADTSTDHYTAGVAWYDPLEVTNKYRTVRINDYGQRMHNASLTITDDYNRLIDISNRTGLLAKDAAGKVIHDIPNAFLLSKMLPGGHPFPLEAVTYESNIALVYTDTNTSRTVTSSTTNVDIASSVPAGQTNVKAAFVMCQIELEASTNKVQNSMLLIGAAKYSTAYNVAPGANNYLHYLYSGMPWSSGVNTVQFGSPGFGVVPVFYVGGVPYITWNATMTFAGMVANNASYALRAFLYVLSLLF